MIALVIVALLSFVGTLFALLVQAHKAINRFPDLIADRLSQQQVGWMEALNRKDKELRQVTEAYLAYQQKAVPIDPDRPMAPRPPAAFRMKPNPPLTQPEKGK